VKSEVEGRSFEYCWGQLLFFLYTQNLKHLHQRQRLITYSTTLFFFFATFVHFISIEHKRQDDTYNIEKKTPERDYQRSNSIIKTHNKYEAQEGEKILIRWG